MHTSETWAVSRRDEQELQPPEIIFLKYIIQDRVRNDDISRELNLPSLKYAIREINGNDVVIWNEYHKRH